MRLRDHDERLGFDLIPFRVKVIAAGMLDAQVWRETLPADSTAIDPVLGMETRADHVQCVPKAVATAAELSGYRYRLLR